MIYKARALWALSLGLKPRKAQKSAGFKNGLSLAHSIISYGYDLNKSFATQPSDIMCLVSGANRETFTSFPFC